MMFQKGGFVYTENLNYQAVKLPYKGDRQSMLIFLPKENLDELEKDLSSNDIHMALNGFTTNVNVHLPKFKLEYMEVFNKYLIKKGMGTAFSSNADFS